jgi:hypothetical protein
MTDKTIALLFTFGGAFLFALYALAQPADLDAAGTAALVVIGGVNWALRTKPR